MLPRFVTIWMHLGIPCTLTTMCHSSRIMSSGASCPESTWGSFWRLPTSDRTTVLINDHMRYYSSDYITMSIKLEIAQNTRILPFLDSNYCYWYCSKLNLIDITWFYSSNSIRISIKLEHLWDMVEWFIRTKYLALTHNTEPWTAIEIAWVNISTEIWTQQIFIYLFFSKDFSSLSTLIH